MRDDFRKQNVIGLDQLLCRANLTAFKYLRLPTIVGGDAVQLKGFTGESGGVNAALLGCNQVLQSDQWGVAHFSIPSSSAIPD